MAVKKKKKKATKEMKLWRTNKTERSNREFREKNEKTRKLETKKEAYLEAVVGCGKALSSMSDKLFDVEKQLDNLRNQPGSYEDHQREFIEKFGIAMHEVENLY